MTPTNFFSRTIRIAFACFLVVAFAACDSTDSGGEQGDSTPPSLVSASSNGTSVSANFDEALDPTSVVASSFTLSPGGAITSASSNGSTVTLVLAGALEDEERQTYTLTATGIRDMAGNAASTVSTTFTFGDGGGGSGSASQEVGAAYPNAGDSRIILLNTDGNRFVRINLSSGAVTDADDIDDLENGQLPLDDVSAAANEGGSQPDTYFFSTDGDTYTKYERDQSDFDAPGSFEDEFDEAGYELTSIGAAVSVLNSNHILLFNQNGTQYQQFFYEDESFGDANSFPAEFGDGSSPIPSVGAAFYVEEADEIYLFDRAGERYTIYSVNSGTFTAAFNIADLGDIVF